MPSMARPPPSMASWRPNQWPTGRGRWLPGRRPRRAPRSAVARTRLRRGTVLSTFVVRGGATSDRAALALGRQSPGSPCPVAATRARSPTVAPEPESAAATPPRRITGNPPEHPKTPATPDQNRQQRRPNLATPARSSSRTRRLARARRESRKLAAPLTAPPPRRETVGDDRTQNGAGYARAGNPTTHWLWRTLATPENQRRRPTQRGGASSGMVQQMQKTLLCGITSSYINFLKEIFQ